MIRKSTVVSTPVHTHNQFLVYGTLKSGFGNNHYMRGAEFVGVMETREAEFVMVDGGVPGVIHAPDDPRAAHVRGEVYRLTQEQAGPVDNLEGNGFFYRSKLVAVTDGTMAWIYTWECARPG